MKLPQYVFVYGTLKQNYGNHRILKDSEFIGAGKTNETFTLINGGFPWAIPDGLFNIKGELYKVTSAQVMNHLDSLEGVPTLFDRHPVHITLEEGETVESMMYVAAPGNREMLLSRYNKCKPNDANEVEWHP